MDSIDFDPYAPSSSGETRKQIEEEIGKVVEETGLTIDDIGADEIFMYFIVDKIFERSAEIKLEEANKKSPDIHSLSEEMKSQ